MAVLKLEIDYVMDLTVRGTPDRGNSFLRQSNPDIFAIEWEFFIYVSGLGKTNCTSIYGDKSSGYFSSVWGGLPHNYMYI